MSRRFTKNIFIALAMSALFSIPSYGQSECASCSETSANFDKASGLCLPATIEGFEEVRFPEYVVSANRAYRNTVVAGYNRTSNRLAITAYLYDRDATPDEADLNETRSVVAEILSVHKGGKLEMGGKGSLPLGGEATDAQFGLFTWQEGDDDYASFLWLIPRGKRYLKLRATYVRPNVGESEAMKYALESVQKVATEICSPR